MNVKKGDAVMVIAGNDKGKSGVIIACHPSTNRVTVEGINIVHKTKKARSAQEKSGIVDMPAPIDVSNVMPICPACGKAVRVNTKVETVDGKAKKVRICNKCGAELTAKAAKAKGAQKRASRRAKKED